MMSIVSDLCLELYVDVPPHVHRLVFTRFTLKVVESLEFAALYWEVQLN